MLARSVSFNAFGCFYILEKDLSVYKMISNVLEDVDAAVGHMQFISWR